MPLVETKNTEVEHVLAEHIGANVEKMQHLLAHRLALPYPRKARCSVCTFPKNLMKPHHYMYIKIGLNAERMNLLSPSLFTE